MTAHAISVDVEEYFHAANLAAVAPREKWDTMLSRVEVSTKKVLDLFARNNVQATFFVLGYVAKKYPQLIKEISAANHEIASHGFNHQLVYTQQPEEFYEDISSSKDLLENLIGKEVIGYRAPNFSITDRCNWAYDKLIEARYRYDSSLFPTWHPRYGNLGKKTELHLLRRENGNLIICPLTVFKLEFGTIKFPIPIAGGAYWRLLPKQMILFLLSQAAKKRGLNCYFHPWEFDTEQPKFNELQLITKLRHYGGTAQMEATVEKIINRHNFTTIKNFICENASSSQYKQVLEANFL